MASDAELAKLRQMLQSVLVEVEMAMDSGTYPDWSDTKENLLRAIESVRSLERDQMWSAISKKKR